jgi:hypothetical protein
VLDSGVAQIWPETRYARRSEAPGLCEAAFGLEPSDFEVQLGDLAPATAEPTANTQDASFAATAQYCSRRTLRR